MCDLPDEILVFIARHMRGLSLWLPNARLTHPRLRRAVDAHAITTLTVPSAFLCLPVLARRFPSVTHLTVDMKPPAPSYAPMSPAYVPTPPSFHPPPFPGTRPGRLSTVTAARP
jgi:hypothetical protein